MAELRPRQHRGTVPDQPEVYGSSLQGHPLEVWPARAGRARLLIVAGVHGEEPETTVALSSALRSVPARARSAAVVLAANPDGLARGTRGNARGVDLNRNFPCADWSADRPAHHFTRSDPQDVLLSSGQEPASEPETRALIELALGLRPAAVVAVHAPLGCVIDARESPFGAWLAGRAGLPLRRAVPSPTPGTFDTWVGERLDVPCVTFELPVISKDAALVGYLDLFADLIGAAPIGGLGDADAPSGSG